ncbi:hypothetical protein HYQ44_005865 [Verticillium longisporum]|nr:hypothetical protein HYQ44_005865 [Verticillium longisporum]
MQLTSVLLAAVAAMTVSAAPSTTSPNSAEAALGGHHAPRCHGNMEYDPWKKQCKCDRGEYYDAEVKHCRNKEVKTFKYKKCRADEKLYCARDEGTYVEYNRKNPACWQERSNKLFCAKKSRVKETFKAEIQREYEVAHYSAAQRQQTEVRRKACHTPRHFNHHRNSCECPHKKASFCPATSLAHLEDGYRSLGRHP